jgi:hypothetical protein
MTNDKSQKVYVAISRKKFSWITRKMVRNRMNENSENWRCEFENLKWSFVKYWTEYIKSIVFLIKY